MLDEIDFRRHYARKPSRRDTPRVRAELRPHPPDDAIDQTCIPVVEAGLDRADGGPPNHFAGLAHVDARQSRSALEERIRGNLHTRTDHAAQIFSLRGYGIEGRRGAEIDDDQGNLPVAA